MPVLSLLALLTGCSTQAPDPRPDILVVVLDTLRQDRVGAYGYERDTTPVLDALAAKGTRYSEAHSTGGWTTPAHASLFTGLYPAAHGATQEYWTLDDKHQTLAEVMGAAGYRTVGVSGNPMLATNKGFAQGFDHYEESWRAKNLKGTRDEYTVEWLRAELGKRGREPQLVFVNLIGIHSPYDSCGSDCGAFGARLGGGPVDNNWQEYYLGRFQPSPESLVRLSDLYDAEVKHADALLGSILEAFDEATGERRQLVVVTSDHGENIGEHGHLDHVFSLYETTVRVPLVVYGTGVPVEVDSSPVQLHDVFATLTRAAGVEAPSQGLPLSEVPDTRPVVVEYYKPVQASRMLEKRAENDEERARLARFQRRLHAYTAEHWKAITASDGHGELYNLAADPSEAADLALPEAERLERMRVTTQTVLERLSREHSQGEVPAADAETQAALEALGYLE